MIKLHFDANKVNAAKAISVGLAKKPNLFLSQDTDTSLTRLELSMPSFNYILSGRYFGPHSGFALGKIYNFFGPEQAGKTAMALQIGGEILPAGGSVHLEDAEASHDDVYTFDAYGLTTREERFIVSKSNTAEQAFDTLIELAKAGVTLQIVDSIPALQPSQAFAAEADKNTVALLARRLSEHFPRITKHAIDNLSSVIYINQLRVKFSQIGGMMVATGKGYTGGEAMKYYAHTSVEFTREANSKSQMYDKNEDFIGQIVTIEAVKNKCGQPHNTADLWLIPGKGFSREMDILFTAEKIGTVHTKGSWYYLGDQAVGNGLQQCYRKLQERPDFVEEIWRVTKEAITSSQLPIPEDANVDEETGEITAEEAIETKKGTRK